MIYREIHSELFPLSLCDNKHITSDAALIVSHMDTEAERNPRLKYLQLLAESLPYYGSV